MPQGISPNQLNKISEVYLSQISEHHKKDADGNTIPNEGEEVEEGAGLYANIHAKRKRGGKMRKKGDKGAPSSQDFANAARTAKEEVEVDEAMSSYDRNRKAAAKRAAERNRLRRAGKMGGRMENETYRNEMGTRMHHKGYKAEEINPTVEQAVQSLDEVSKKTLGSYVKKASTEIGTSAIKGDYKKMQKRHKGVLDASDKMAKEEFVNEAKDKKGKGSGTKDACYHCLLYTSPSPRD